MLSHNLVDFDITPAQFKVLASIGHGRCHSPAEICKSISIDGGSMSRMFDRLEKKSLLVRTPNPEDKRSVVLKLTSEGDELLKGCIKVAEAINAELIGDFTEDEVAQLFHLLKKLLPSSQILPSSCTDNQYNKRDA